MMPSTSTCRASRRKSTLPSMPRLRSGYNKSMLFLAITVLLHRVGCCSDKDDAVALFLPPVSCYTTSWDSTPGRGGPGDFRSDGQVAQ